MVNLLDVWIFLCLEKYGYDTLLLRWINSNIPWRMVQEKLRDSTSPSTGRAFFGGVILQPCMASVADSGANQDEDYISHTIHVWYIYLHVP